MNFMVILYRLNGLLEHKPVGFTQMCSTNLIAVYGVESQNSGFSQKIQKKKLELILMCSK